ncbi:hypothetical protein CNR22_09990 [Sphingobacteriaceae bacterium]|nr:hypothetical protein CNR22_09990 [Sphingobacteriaceae bacterium]
MHYSKFIKGLFIFSCALLFSNCGKNPEEEKNTVPKHIMSEETFTRVLTDFALAESAANMNIKNADLQKLDSIYNFNPLLDNGVTQVEYDSAVAFYARHQVIYKRIYENVLAALNDLQAKRNPIVKDSISK